MTTVEVKIKANKESSYPIIIEKGILDNAYEYIKQYTNAKRFIVVTNTTIYPLYGEKLKNDNIKGENNANITHYNMGRDIRKFIAVLVLTFCNYKLYYSFRKSQINISFYIVYF